MTSRPFAYVDTSLLVKCYLRESDSAEVITLLRNMIVATSSISTVELVSTVYAAYRARGLSKAQLESILRRMDRDRNEWYRLDVTPTVIEQARGVVATHTLRSVDAIHCASALVLREARAEAIVFATSDRRQRSAATALGFTCLDV